MSLFCSGRPRRDDDDREMSRENAVTMLVEVMKEDPVWKARVTASERREIAGRLVDTRRAVREGRLSEDRP